MDCRSRIIRYLILRILCAPAVTVSSCPLNRRIPSSGWKIPSAFLRASIRWRLRRCHIRTAAPIRSAVVMFCAVFALGLVLSGCRQDMHNQPKFIPLRSSEFFTDRRSARYPVPGTMPQLCPNGDKQPALCVDKDVDTEQLNPDSYFLTGRRSGALGNDLPDELKSEGLHDLLVRGQQRYGIYCTPCHS